MNIYEKLQHYQIEPSSVNNAHVHLPELTVENQRTVLSPDKHALFPAKVIADSIAKIAPECFLQETEGILGQSILLPIGEHNIDRKASLLYASNDYVLRLASFFPNSFIPFGSLDLSQSGSATQIERLQRNGIVGIKYHAIEGYPLVIGDEVSKLCEPALAAMAELNMPLVTHLGDTPFRGIDLNNARPSMLIPIAKKFPKLRMMITHFGTPLHLEAFWVAGSYENIFMDTAEYPIYWRDHVDNPYGPLLSPLHTKRIGSDKIIFGTDFPMPTLREVGGSYQITVHEIAHYVAAFLDLPTKYFSPLEKRRILSENIWIFLNRSKEEIYENNLNIARERQIIAA